MYYIFNYQNKSSYKAIKILQTYTYILNKLIIKINTEFFIKCNANVQITRLNSKNKSQKLVTNLLFRRDENPEIWQG